MGLFEALETTIEIRSQAPATLGKILHTPTDIFRFILRVKYFFFLFSKADWKRCIVPQLSNVDPLKEEPSLMFMRDSRCVLKYEKKVGHLRALKTKPSL